MDSSDHSDSEFEVVLEQDDINRDEIDTTSGLGLNDVNNVINMIPSVPQEQKPYEGREFQSVDLAYDFYNAYARVAGFSVRKARSWNRKGGISYHQFVCSKEGFRKTTIDGDNLNRRAETRCGCKAFVEFKVIDGVYRVRRFIEEHNHILSTPSKAHLHRSSKKMSEGAKNLVRSWVDTGVGPSQCHNILANEAGGYDKIGFDEQNIKVLIRNTARQTYGNDANSMMNYFRKKQEENPSFYFAVQLDEIGQLCNCFWVDARGRLDFYDFGDVVSFDTTYKKNKYLMPFAPFTGVNHHRQSIVFGCVLLVDETEQSFMWLFEEWLKAMGNRYPRAIITDQDPAMKAAISKVFPHTVHRFCMWHILQKVPEKLGYVYRQHPDFKEKWDRCIYGPENIEEFEELWIELIREFCLGDIGWLKDLWEIRHMWVPSYLKNVFFAGMSTTQRSESMNDFFKDWVNVHTTLNDFVHRFDMALKKRRELEKREDYNTVNAKPIMLVQSEMEEQLQRTLTRNMFNKFQEELLKIGSCSLGSVEEDGLAKIYQVRSNYRRKNFTVLYIESDQTVECSCRKFNFEGILCRHIFFVFMLVGLVQVPLRYILKRWRRDARTGIVHDPSCSIPLREDCQKSVTVRYNDLMLLANRYAATGAMFDDSYVEAKEVLERSIIDLERKNKERLLSEAIGNEGSQATEVGDHISSSIHPASEPQSYTRSQLEQCIASQCGSTNFISIRDPKITKAKGSGKRIGRLCRTCNRAGHDSRNCPKKKNQPDEFNA